MLCRTLDVPGISGVPISHRALDVLKDFAPGAQLPVLLYNGEPKTDTIAIEEFLEDQLGPPMSVAGAALRGGRGPLKKGRTSRGKREDEPVSLCHLAQLCPCPRRCPSLVPQYPESSLAGNDIFHKFSAFIKNPVPAQDDGEERVGQHPVQPLRCYTPKPSLVILSFPSSPTQTTAGSVQALPSLCGSVWLCQVSVGGQRQVPA